MKRFFLIVSLLLLTGLATWAQDDNADDKTNPLQQRMQEYIQNRLNLSRNEAEKFSPIFLRYIVELRRTHRENINDRTMLQMKVAELRIRFRGEFRQVIDEQRANKIYDYQREFEIKIKTELQNRRMENKLNRRNRAFFQ